LKLLGQTPAEKVVFVVYVDPDVRKPGSFDSVRDAYIRVADKDNTELARFTLPPQNTTSTAMIFGEIYKHNNEWKFRAVGQGYSAGIVGVAKDFQVGL
jgi:tellurium resistance protein TerD